MLKKRRSPTGRGVVRKRLVRHTVAPPPIKVWAIRKGDWIEIRLSPDRPVRKVSTMTLGEQRFSTYMYVGGESVGSIERSSFPEFHYMANRDMIEVTGALAEQFTDPLSREELFD